MMRLKQVALLVSFYLRFVQRRVLRRGLLASRMARLTVGAIAAGTLGLLTMIAFLFLSRTAGDAGVLSFFLDLSSLTAVLWVLVAFIFIKVLFLKAEHMLALTYHLPVTARERAAALLMFEVLLVTGVIAVLFTSSVVPIVILHGTSALLPIWYALCSPVIVAHLILNTAYLAAQRLLALVGLQRSRTVILLSVVAMLTGLYYTLVISDTVAIAAAYGTGESVLSIPGIFTYLAREVGWYAAFGVFAVTTGVLLVSSAALLPRTYVPSQRHVPLPLGGLVRIPQLGPLLAMCTRSSEWVLAAVLGAILGVVLLATGFAPPVLGCGLMVLQGIGLYAKASRLRWLRLGKPVSGVVFYIALLGAQALAVGPLAILLTIGALAKGDSAAVQLGAAAGVIGGILLVTLIGILFPSDHDNPFSAAIGVGVVGCVAVLAILSTSVLNLTPPALLGCGVIVAILLISLSLAGISINERRSRYEEGNLNPDGGAHGADHHPHHRHRLTAVGNVRHDG